jgi:hypothetical protein
MAIHRRIDGVGSLWIVILPDGLDQFKTADDIPAVVTAQPALGGSLERNWAAETVTETGRSRHQAYQGQPEQMPRNFTQMKSLPATTELIGKMFYQITSVSCCLQGEISK